MFLQDIEDLNTSAIGSLKQSGLFGLKSDFLCLDVAKDIVPKFLWAAEKLLLGAGQRNGGAKRKARCAVEG